jgi:DNA-binding MarR family transcriptional regulator
VLNASREFVAFRGRCSLSQQQSLRTDKSINFRIHRLASSLFKGAQQFYGAYFNIGLPEVRILSNLSSEGPLTAAELVTLTAMDKALVSRILNVLSGRGLLEAVAPAAAPRRRIWSLSRDGRRLTEALRPEWTRREAVIQTGLTAAERKQLGVVLERLFVASEALREQEAAELRASRSPGTTRRSRTRPEADKDR